MAGFARRFLASLLLGCAVGALPPAGHAGAPDTRSALESDPTGWRNIAPNEKLEGWTRLPVPAGGQLGRAQWHVDPAAGTLICDGDGGHDWLRYDRELANFIVHVEWRFFPVEGKSGYNSGIYVRNSADGRIWHQAQVGSANDGFLFGDSPMGGEVKRFRTSRNVRPTPVRPAGEWNTYELTCVGPTIRLWINGRETAELTGCEVLRGYFGLEGEGWKIAFRNIRLKELP